MTPDPNQLIAVAIAAVWAAFGSAMTVISRLNETRDRVLSFTEAGTRLTPDQRRFLVWWDYVPIWVSVVCFISIFTLALTLFAWSAFTAGWRPAGVVCVACALFGVLGLGLQLRIGLRTIRMMTAQLNAPAQGGVAAAA